AEKPDHWHRRLLCARRKRPGDNRAADQRDELTPSHCAQAQPRRLSRRPHVISPALLPVELYRFFARRVCEPNGRASCGTPCEPVLTHCGALGPGGMIPCAIWLLADRQ